MNTFIPSPEIEKLLIQWFNETYSNSYFKSNVKVISRSSGSMTYINPSCPDVNIYFSLINNVSILNLWGFFSAIF